MAIRTGSGAGNPGKKGRVTAGLAALGKQGQAARPLRPTEDSFPSKGEFRLGHYKVLEERDDYLICIGFDPNAKDPFAHITPSARRKIKVAKPWALQRTPWESGSFEIGSLTYTYTYSDTEYGVRTATWTDADGIEQEEEQRIDIPYTVGELEETLIVAVEIRDSAAVDGMDVEDEDGARLSWMDQNVDGRRWLSPSTADPEETTADVVDSCNCNNCLGGVTMPASSTVCCTSHPSWEFTDPWLGGTKTLNWTTGNVWLTDKFDGPEDGAGLKNEYKWKLTVSATMHASILELVLETDNGADVECLKYIDVNGFQCLCNNLFRVDVWGNLPRGDVACTACIKPKVLDSGEVECPTDCTSRDPLYLMIGQGVSSDLCVQEVMDWLEGLKSASFDADNSTWSFTNFLNTGGCTAYPCIWEAITEYSLTESSCNPGAKVALVVTSCGSGKSESLIQLMYRDDTYTAGKWQSVAVWENSEPCINSDTGSITFTNRVPTGPYGSVGDITVLGSFTGDVESDGSCAGCTTDAAPADAEGACCLGVDCLDVSEADCTTLAGTWYATDAECETACSTDGACCVEVLNGRHDHYCYNFPGEGYCDDIATVFASLGTVNTSYFPGQFCNFSDGGTIDCGAQFHSPSSSPSSSPSATGSSSPSASPSSSPSSSVSSSPSSSPSGADPTGCCESFVSSPCADGYTQADCDAESGVWCEDGTCTPGGCSCP